LRSVEKSLRKKLWTYRKADEVVVMKFNVNIYVGLQTDALRMKVSYPQLVISLLYYNYKQICAVRVCNPL
jgi:hypothetical protein